MCLDVNELQVRGLFGVHEVVLNHLSNHFKLARADTPSIENLNFNTLDDFNAHSLETLFMENEVCLLGIVIVSKKLG